MALDWRDQKQAIILLVCMIALPVCLGLWMYLSTYPNHDVAWVLWGSREMLRGAQYGVDIIEPNPPLAWYLSMPTTALADWLGVPIDRVFFLTLIAASAASAMSLAWLRPHGMSLTRSSILAGVAATALIPLMGREFGQREPLMLVFVLPYLALSARSFDGNILPKPLACAMIGASAGIGFALKPYFLLVPTFCELMLLVRKGRKYNPFRVENLAMVAVGLFYGIWLLAFEYEYIVKVVPMAREIYWSFDNNFTYILTFSLLYIFGFLVLLIFSIKLNDGFGLIFSGALLGFILSFLLQFKGYAYHFLPVRVVSILILTRFVLDVRQPLPFRAMFASMASIFLFMWMAPLLNWWDQAKPGGPLYNEIGQINQSIATHAPGDRYFVITIRTYPNFPAGIYAPARYGSRTNAQWFLPAVAQLRDRGTPSPSVEANARSFVLHDLRAKPALVLLDTNPKGHTAGPEDFDILGFYMEDPAFRTEWSHYREIERIGTFRQFVRVKPNPAPPSIESKAAA